MSADAERGYRRLMKLFSKLLLLLAVLAMPLGMTAAPAAAAEHHSAAMPVSFEFQEI